MNFSEKLPAFANPQGAAGKLLIASMNIFESLYLGGVHHLNLLSRNGRCLTSGQRRNL